MVIDALVSKLRAKLVEPVDLASIAALRVLLGGVLAFAAVRFVAKGWVHELLLAPAFHFTYPSFEFVRPLPSLWMHGFFLLLTACALSLMVGYKPRLAAALCAAGFAYVELIERASYLNHYYLMCLMSALLACLPTRGAVPRWMLALLRLQVGVVYVFAGFAKLNADWLLDAQPLRIWLPAASAQLSEPAFAYIASWAGAAFDLLIVPALLLRRTRAAAYVVACVFHLATAWLFPIGMFPFVMLASLTVFLPPDWPRKWIARPARSRELTPTPRALVCLLGLHCLVQVGVPLHHHLFVRDSAWTQAGFDFAWKVMLAEKSGSVRYTLRERGANDSSTVDPAQRLAPFQLRALGQDPRLIVAFARQLRAEQLATGRDVAVYADAQATLNGRPLQRLIAADVDLTRDPLPTDLISPLR
jgi:hypothetical protein